LREHTTSKCLVTAIMTPDHPYRYPSLGDLTRRVAKPLVRDRIAIARPAKDQPGPLTDLAGFAIWTSVSKEVDAKIREQQAVGCVNSRTTHRHTLRNGSLPCFPDPAALSTHGA
jgi:hypothetical protein